MEACEDCSSHNIAIVKKTRLFTGSGKKRAKIEVEMSKCNDCGEEFFNKAQQEAIFQKCREAGLVRSK